MGFKDIRLKFKGLRLRRLLVGEARGNTKVSGGAKKPSWMNSISHGYHVVEGRTFRIDQSSHGETDTVVVQREQIGHLELWFYGVSDAKIGKKITRHMQSHLFDRKLNEHQITRKCKEALRKAYLNARAELRDSTEGNEQSLNVGSASVMVINGEKLVIANMGDYKAVVCKDGVAHQLRTRHCFAGRRRWPRRFLSGAIRMPRVRIQACSSGKEASSRSSKSSELAFAAERVDSETEFIILSSNGVWEVMKYQEAVNLISHIDDPQEAAECVAREALTRMSRGNISCLIIRFD